jgi:hypothetical protein
MVRLLFATLTGAVNHRVYGLSLKDERCRARRTRAACSDFSGGFGAENGSASRLDVHCNLLHGEFASEPKRRRKFEAIALLRPLDAVPVNEVLSVRVLAVQPQALDSRELEDDDGLSLTSEVSRPVHSRAHVPCVNPNHGKPTAIDNDGEDLRVVKRRPVAEPRDDRICAEDFGDHWSHAELDGHSQPAQRRFSITA